MVGSQPKPMLVEVETCKVHEVLGVIFKVGADCLDSGAGLPEQLMHDNCISHHRKDHFGTQLQEMRLFERFT